MSKYCPVRLCQDPLCSVLSSQLMFELDVWRRLQQSIACILPNQFLFLYWIAREIESCFNHQRVSLIFFETVLKVAPFSLHMNSLMMKPWLLRMMLFTIYRGKNLTYFLQWFWLFGFSAWYLVQRRIVYIIFSIFFNSNIKCWQNWQWIKLIHWNPDRHNEDLLTVILKNGKILCIAASACGRKQLFLVVAKINWISTNPFCSCPQRLFSSHITSHRKCFLMRFSTFFSIFAWQKCFNSITNIVFYQAVYTAHNLNSCSQAIQRVDYHPPWISRPVDSCNTIKSQLRNELFVNFLNYHFS